jgi:DNA-binding CsgD family transcriptional regulator
MTRPATAPPTETRLDRQLLTQVERLMTEARSALGDREELPPSPSGSMTMAVSMLSAVSATALSRIEGPGAAPAATERLTALSLRALDLLDSVHGRIGAQRTRTYAQMRQGLDRLRRVANSAALIDRVCIEVVETCGFSRAILTRVEGEEWLPWMAYFPADRDLEGRFTEWMNQQKFPASALGRDLHRLRPVVVRDAAADPRSFGPMIEFSQTPAYVAAPITPAGGLVGILYADRFGTDHSVDELDRDLLWAFAEGFGRIYERVVLIERMRAQQAQISKAFELAENMMSALASAEIELSRTAEGRMPTGDEAELQAPAAPAAVEELLTTREAEVLAMMVRGASNAQIAEQLIIKEGTVKSHVKHILRKLDAVNRAEAISRYMGRSEAGAH